jgi:GGDEF domain-containing protein
MDNLYKTSLLVLLFACQSAFADLGFKDGIRFWQLFDNNNLALPELIGTPNDDWTSLPDGHTKLNALESSIWQDNQKASMWIKIELPRIIDTDKIWIELAPNVGLYGKMAIYENGIWSWKLPAGRAGSTHPKFPATFLTFAVEDPRQHRLIFLKVNSSQTLHFSINVRSHDTQLSLLASRNLIYGLCLGLMILAAIYNTAIGISARQRAYLYYATYILAMALYLVAMTGYNRLAFPEWGGDGSFANLTACLTMFAATIFVREFLETQHKIPKLDLLLRGLSSSIFVTIFLLGVIADSIAFILVATLAIVVPIILLICGLGAYKAKHPMAKYFLVAWFAHIITGSSWAWMWFGFGSPTIDLLNIFIAGSITEQLILSILLGYNYAKFKSLKAQSEANSEYRNTNTEIDGLTGLYNRQSLYGQIEKAISSSETDLIWIDVNIDNFAEFNARHGIHQGDLLLSEFGQLLQTKVRRDNLAAKLIDKESSFSYRRGVAGRTCGGQFTIILSNCSLPQARLYVERLTRDFESIQIKSLDGNWVSSTICVGVVSVLPNDSFQSAWQRASKKLESAKAKGAGQLAFS